MKEKKSKPKKNVCDRDRFGSGIFSGRQKFKKNIQHSKKNMVAIGNGRVVFANVVMGGCFAVGCDD